MPTLHGFDEFYGYLYHLDAMEDHCRPNFPQALQATIGARNMVHSWAANVDDPTVQPRWGKIGKPFFLWLNPTRMHVVTHLSPKYNGLRNSDNGWSNQEAGMAQLDDIVGSVMKYVKDNGLDGDTIIGFTTDNGVENFAWPDGGQTPFAGATT